MKTSSARSWLFAPTSSFCPILRHFARRKASRSLHVVQDGNEMGLNQHKAAMTPPQCYGCFKISEIA